MQKKNHLIQNTYMYGLKYEDLPGLEPRIFDSKSNVLTNYTISPCGELIYTCFTPFSTPFQHQGGRCAVRRQRPQPTIWL